MVTICRKQRSKCNDFFFSPPKCYQPLADCFMRVQSPTLNSNLATNQLNPLVDAAKSIVR